MKLTLLVLFGLAYSVGLVFLILAHRKQAAEWRELFARIRSRRVTVQAIAGEEVEIVGDGCCCLGEQMPSGPDFSPIRCHVHPDVEPKIASG